MIEILWIDEADDISENTWGILISTIRKSGSENWVTFNPHLATDPTYPHLATDDDDHYLYQIEWDIDDPVELLPEPEPDDYAGKTWDAFKGLEE